MLPPKYGWSLLHKRNRVKCEFSLFMSATESLPCMLETAMGWLSSGMAQFHIRMTVFFVREQATC